jgi:hypothetical protein
MKPTNVSLLDPKSIIPGLYGEVSSTDSFEGMTQNLNPDGLFSVEIFGRVGTDKRDTTEAFIRTYLPIFNPTYFDALVKLKSLYLGIIKGATYAVWDASEKDFIKSNILDGETGFAFFMKHFGQLDPKENSSPRRKQRITLVKEKFDYALHTRMLVIPAGLRDVEFTPSGESTKVVEPEINELYRKLMFKTRAVQNIPAGDEDNPLYDNVRWGIQSAINAIDDYLFDMLDGKGGVLQSKLATRGVVGGVRNILTARKVSRSDLDDDDGVNPNSSDIGLFQGLMNFQYSCIHALMKNFIEHVFTLGSNNVKLIDPKTLSYTYEELNPAVIDKWTTVEGLVKLFNGFKAQNLRFKPITINQCYLALVYDDGKDVMVLFDIEELPADRDRKYVTPLTYVELFYIYCHDAITSNMMQQTRYPIIGIGSIYPSFVNLKTIQGAKPRNIISPYGEVITRVNNYPHKAERTDFFDSLSVDPTRISGLDGDHDGDQLGCNGLCTEESKAEVRALFGRRDYYIDGSGEFLYDPLSEPVVFLLKAATSGLKL